MMFGKKECVAVVWDSDRNVSGVRLRSAPAGAQVVAKATNTDMSIDFPSRLSTVYRELGASPDSTVILGPHLSGCCLEIKLPKVSDAEVAQLLQFEIPRRLPFPVEELVWYYRVVPQEEQPGQGFTRTRIATMRVHEWNVLLTEIAAARIKADHILSPFMCVDPIASRHRTIALPLFRPEACFEYRPEEQRRVMVVSGEAETAITDLEKEVLETHDMSLEDDRAYVPALLCGEYGLSDNCRSDAKGFLRLPSDIVPRRNVFLKVASIALLTTALILGGAYAVRSQWHRHLRKGKLVQETRQIQKQITRLVAERKAMANVDTVIAKLDNDDDTDSVILKGLFEVGRILPDHMWITSFNARGPRIDLAFRATGDVRNAFTLFNSLKSFTAKNIRTRRAPDGVYVYVTLEAKK